MLLTGRRRRPLRPADRHRTDHADATISISP